MPRYAHSKVAIYASTVSGPILWLDAYEEDYVQSLQGGGHYFARLKNCTRCPLPNVNPETAEVGDQPSKALASSRRSEAGILFGINMALYHASESPFIEVGQTLEVEYEV